MVSLQLELGKIYTVFCIKILETGAVFQLEDNSTEFIHISQLANHYVKYVENEVSVGVSYTAICVLYEKGNKLELSLKVNDESRKQHRASLDTLDAFYREQAKVDNNQDKSLKDKKKHRRRRRK